MSDSENTEYKKCPNCNRKTDGVDDYKSLVAGSTSIKKTCIKCRKEAYQSFRKRNPKKEKEVIDYNKEYLDHLRCKNCNRKTNGIEDFKNIRSGNITKTCLGYRKSVYAALKKKPQQNNKTYTNRDKIMDLMLLLDEMDNKDRRSPIKSRKSPIKRNTLLIFKLLNNKYLNK